MAFDRERLKPLFRNNGFTLWRYTTRDPAGTVESPGYFNEAQEALRTGDRILANVDTGATPTARDYDLSGKPGGVVRVARVRRADRLAQTVG